ncbi:MAG: hypothetical protein IMX03_07085 [Brockia lithotrophica]|nr:hypothetical protein [Brockia lithotrophica]
MDEEALSLLARVLEEGAVSVPVALFRHYAKLGLDERDVVLLLHLLAFRHEGDPLPSPRVLASVTTMAERDIAERLRSLVDRGFLAIERHEEDGALFEGYSLHPLYLRLATSLAGEVRPASLVERLESLLGRPLSVTEIDLLAAWREEGWEDGEILRVAEEAAAGGIRSLREVARFLSRPPASARKRGARTSDAWRQEAREVPRLVQYNWLEADEEGES